MSDTDLARQLRNFAPSILCSPVAVPKLCEDDIDFADQASEMVPTRAVQFWSYAVQPAGELVGAPATVDERSELGAHLICERHRVSSE